MNTFLFVLIKMTRSRSKPKTRLGLTLFIIILVLIIVGVVLYVVFSPGKKPSAPGPASSKLSFYVEDCQQSGNLKYNYDKLAKEFDFIGLDFSPRCYPSIKTTIDALNNNGYSGQLGIHFDQTAGSACWTTRDTF